MSFQFSSPDRLAFEIRRVAAERLGNAVGQLDSGLERDATAAIHEARKDIKKVRSLLRLVKTSFAEEHYRAENDRLRAAAHELAEVREADALVESLSKLVLAKGESMSDETVAAARLWSSRVAAKPKSGPGVKPAAAAASALLEAAREDARAWALGYGNFELIAPGVRRTYRQGRRWYLRAEEARDEETLHEWRKRVKDLWYCLRLVGPAWEPVLRRLADEAHALSDLLGDHHDLGEVRAAIRSSEAGLSTPSGTELQGLAEARQAELHAEAITLGRRLYAERPGRYTERIGRLWAAWEADAAQQVGQDGLPGS